MVPVTIHTGSVRTIGEVAQEYGVTVRTLHHYDGIGLLTPSQRSDGGYRLYTDADQRRLAAIVGYRRLGFPLQTIGRLLDGEEPLADHLRRQRAAVIHRLDELRSLVAALDTALEHEMNDKMTDADLRALFGDGFDDTYAAEAQDRWGHTDAWQQGQARTASYTREQWQAIKTEGDAIIAAFAAALTNGEPADGDVAGAAVRAHREHIQRWFFDLDDHLHARLGELYAGDQRYGYDDIAPGLGAYVGEAITSHAQRRA